MEEFSKLQKQVFEYDEKNNWLADDSREIVLHMQEELGEIAREILRFCEYKKDKIFLKEKLSEEISDLFYLTLKLANKFQIQLDESWSNMWERYKAKVSRK
ncbi:MAG: hypothetical protein QW802_01825 [Candidatus Altiarchaeota archaeon]